MTRQTLEQPLVELKQLLADRNNDESEYQALLARFPWVLGAQYTKVQRHAKLDDQNIPDFTAVRVHDHCRDVIEMKPPFTELFRQDGAFNVKFLEYWDQAERYLDFATQQPNYLASKGLRMANPQCYLIMGYQLTDENRELIRRKERNSRNLRLLTYDDLIVFMQSTIAFLRQRVNEAN